MKKKTLKITKHQIDEMVLLFNEGLRPIQIAKKINTPLPNVYQCLRRRGVRVCEIVNIEKKPLGDVLSGRRIKKYIKDLYDPNNIITKEVLGLTYVYD